MRSRSSRIGRATSNDARFVGDGVAPESGGNPSGRDRDVRANTARRRRYECGGAFGKTVESNPTSAVFKPRGETVCRHIYENASAATDMIAPICVGVTFVPNA